MGVAYQIFYSTHFDKSLKVGINVISARRFGCTATFDEVNRFFTLADMSVATNQYWKNIYGWNSREGKVYVERK